MTLDERLTNVTVIGATGKMGSGISVLLAQEMIKQKLQPENNNKKFRLNLIDMNDDQFDNLIKYVKNQSIKAAEKSIVKLRELYHEREDLVENVEIIHQYVDDILLMIRTETDMNLAKNSYLIFEAIVENIDVKISLLKQLNNLCSTETFFFTNTSSIPIYIINDGAKLNGRIIGFHFYNPPIVQRLAELIPSKDTVQELVNISYELAERLKKKVYLSSDVAGFIGNGHFLRDSLHATNEVLRLSKEFSKYEAIYIVNKICQDLLLRPMGIFQLMDYVGIDVMYYISNIMNTYIEHEDLKNNLVSAMYDEKILGGQRADGSQKDGFFKYKNNKPIGVYDFQNHKYVLYDKGKWKEKLDEKIGNYPNEWASWKDLLGTNNREDKLITYFKNLTSSPTFGAELAKSYLKKSKEIGQHLVDQGIAKSAEDVNGVLQHGFYHLYGPINNYI